MFIHGLILTCALVAAGDEAMDDSPFPGLSQPDAIQQSVAANEVAPAPLPSEAPAGAAAPDAPPAPEANASPAAEPVDVAPPKPKKGPPKPYKPLFYDNDFSYLENPDNEYYYFGDFAKRRHLGDIITFDVGGEYRLRFHDEHILARNGEFLLERTRLYGNVNVGDNFRTYVEAIDATRDGGGALAPRSSEINRFDALNLFADYKVAELESGDLWGRGGRQELLYGNQRLVSPLDWSNTRRTFDGAKLFLKGDEWNIDGFWTRPVPFAQHLIHPSAFDSCSASQQFFGAYATYKQLKDQTLDFYYLGYTENAGRPNFNAHTFGTRWEGHQDNWLWEIEGAYQGGQFGTQDQSAGFYTLGGGRKLASLPWNPVAWVYYDWASGNDPTKSQHGTFNQLFPLGHKYFGYMDMVGRQNIEDLNFQLTLAPTKKVTFELWYHIFHLQDARDALYDAAGTKIRQDATGAAGSDVGEELDTTVKFLITPRADLLVGYSHLFAGPFLLHTTGGVVGRDFTYTQFSLKF